MSNLYTNDFKCAGHLTAEPIFPDKANVANVSICLNRPYKTDGDEWESEPIYVKASAWGKRKEALKGLAKGDAVFALGELRNNDYEKDGQKHRETILLINKIHKIEIQKVSESSEEKAETK